MRKNRPRAGNALPLIQGIESWMSQCLKPSVLAGFHAWAFRGSCCKSSGHLGLLPHQTSSIRSRPDCNSRIWFWMPGEGPFDLFSPLKKLFLEWGDLQGGSALGAGNRGQVLDCLSEANWGVGRVSNWKPKWFGSPDAIGPFLC